MVPNAKQFSANWQDIPAMLMPTDAGDPSASSNPVTMLQIPTDMDRLEERLKIIHFIQHTLRLFAVLYALGRYPERIEESGLGKGAAIFRHGQLVDILRWAEKMSGVPWQGDGVPMEC